MKVEWENRWLTIIQNESKANMAESGTAQKM